MNSKNDNMIDKKTEVPIKFKFDYYSNRLFIKKSDFEQYIPVPKENMFKDDHLVNCLGFFLEKDNKYHWVKFTVWHSSIFCFYRRILEGGIINYYRKSQEKEIITNWEFTEKDTFEKKKDGKWGKKFTENEEDDETY